MSTAQREIWIDWMRVVACFLVIMTHSCEPFYLGGEGSLILTKADALWVSVLNVIPRACVALFVVASSYLQFPLHYPTGEFFRRRAARLLVPFLLWTVVYALVWGEPVQNFKDVLLNFNYAAGHLWFVYMLVGVYLIMPLLSPWAEKVGKKELLAYLGIWLFTTIIPFIRQWAGGPAPVMYGPSGIPNPAKPAVLGEDPGLGRPAVPCGLRHLQRRVPDPRLGRFQGRFPHRGSRRPGRPVGRALAE